MTIKSKSGIVYKIDKKTGKIKVKKIQKLKSKKNRKPNPFERKKRSLERVPDLLKSNETYQMKINKKLKKIVSKIKSEIQKKKMEKDLKKKVVNKNNEKVKKQI